MDGYGNFAPTTPLTKLVTVFYVLNEIGVLVVFLDTLAETRRKRMEDGLATKHVN